MIPTTTRRSTSPQLSGAAPLRALLLAACALLAFRIAPAAAQVAGTLDATFGSSGKLTLPFVSTNARDEAYAVVVDGAGGVLVAGEDRSGSSRGFAIARLLENGGKDPAFGTAGTTKIPFTRTNGARGIGLQADGKIVLVGDTNSLEDFALARLQENGLLDTSFGGNGTVTTSIASLKNDYASAVAIQPDQKIVVVGTADSGPNLDVAVARYTSTGALDTTFSDDGKLTFGLGGNEEGTAVTIDAEGRIVVVGFTTQDGRYDMLVLRLTQAGQPDPTFNGVGWITIPFGTSDTFGRGVAIQPDGSILAVGENRTGSTHVLALARVTEDGALDPSFGNAGRTTTAIGDTAEARGVVLHPSGRFTVAVSAKVNGEFSFAAAQYRNDGTLDPTFGALGVFTTKLGVGADEARAVARQADGKIVLAGLTTPSGSRRDFGLVRLTHSDCGDGTLDAPAEECDGDDLGGVTCCSLDCTIAPFGAGCRGSSGACDVAETCDGVSASCPVDEFVAGGTTCRATQGQCDVPESCSGTGPDCPGDARVAVGTGCRAALGVCDVAEACDGGTSCPSDGYVTGGTPCRSAADHCDAVETCNGASPLCPVDQQAAAGTECRPAADACDAAETCDGATIVCPGDSPRPAGATCRAASGACDVAEACDGVGFACPLDDVAPAGQSCRASAVACDAEELCDGISAICPDDEQLPDGDQDGTCDAQDVCPNTPDSSQGDADGDGEGDACDPCTNGVVIDSAVLRFENLLAPAGDDTFVLKGDLRFSPARPAIDPGTNGMRVRIEDAQRAVLFDAVVPPGKYDPETRTGWRSNVNKTFYRFRSPTAFDGLVNKIKLRVRTLVPDLAELKITGRSSDFASVPAAGPLRAIVVLDPPGAIVGHCGERDFPGPAPAPACGYLTPGPEDLFPQGAVFECR